MKLLGLLSVFIALFLPSVESNTSLNENPVVIIHVETEDCTTFSKRVPLAELGDFDVAEEFSLANINFACTFEMEESDMCAQTESTCAAAERKFRECMCSSGATGWCPEGPGSGGTGSAGNGG